MSQQSSVILLLKEGTKVMVEISKADWKLFRDRIGTWQENYMEQLCEEYVDLLQNNEPASKRFWNIEARVNRDKRLPGVQLRLQKKNVDVDLMRLYKLGIINETDLEGFSDELIERVMELVNIKW